MDPSLLESIPMPPENNSASDTGSADNSATDTSTDAWKKAQAALQKITTSKPAPGGGPKKTVQDGNIQAMLKLYPWMSNFQGFDSSQASTPNQSSWWPSQGYGGGPPNAGSNSFYHNAYGNASTSGNSNGSGFGFPDSSPLKAASYTSNNSSYPASNQQSSNEAKGVNQNNRSGFFGASMRGQSGVPPPMVNYPSPQSYRQRGEEGGTPTGFRPSIPNSLPPPGLATNVQLGDGNQRTFPQRQEANNLPPPVRFQLQRGGGFGNGPSYGNRGGMGNRGRGKFGGYGTRPATGGNNTPLGNGGNSLTSSFVGGGKLSSSETSATPSSGITGNSSFPESKGGGPESGKTMPDGMTKYIERAYMAVDNEDDKNKVEKALRQKLMPLLNTGVAWNMDWEKEPLPTDPAYKEHVPANMGSWTPAAQLKHRQNQAMKQARGRGRNVVGRNVFADDDRDSGRRSRNGRRWGEPSPSPSKRSSRRRKRSESSTSSSDSRDSPRSRPRMDRESENNKKTSSNARNFIIDRKGKKGKVKKWASPAVTMDEEERMKEKRAARFAAKKSARPPPKVVASRIDGSVHDRLGAFDDDWYITYSPSASDSLDLSSYDIVGVCTDIEKPYFRLTVAPDPSQVRPQRILQRSLELVKEKWKKNGDYHYACDQLRSIRQDLTVQRIRNEFTVKCYEVHARIALEKRDREEFNQCQTQLAALYREVPDSPNELEFTAYRLLYYICLENTMEMGRWALTLDKSALSDPCIRFAINVRKAWALHSVHRLFRLYAKAPKMASYAMDLFVERERKMGLKQYIKAFKPTIPVSFIASELGFSSGVSECIEWLTELGIPLSDDGTKIDCRTAASVSF